MYKVLLYLAINLDLISGSTKSAEKRRAKLKLCSDPMAVSEAQCAEIIKQSFIKQIDDWKDKIAQLELDTWNLEKHRGHYQNELTFYRSCVFLYITEDKIPPRPYTPPSSTSQEPAIWEYYRDFLTQNPDKFLISKHIFRNDIRIPNALKGGWNYRERFNYLLHPLISHWHTNKYPLEMSLVNSSDIHLSPE